MVFLMTFWKFDGVTNMASVKEPWKSQLAYGKMLMFLDGASNHDFPFGELW